MVADIIHDRGRGPEIAGTRITVYNLLPHFLDPTESEEAICRLYDLAPEQVAAARAYVLSHPDTVLAEHLKIEARMAAGNAAEDVEKAGRVHADFVKFREWIAERDAAAAENENANKLRSRSAEFPTFREWVAQRARQPAGG
jgi:uncharacterized protein (DUF433 family)